VIVNRGAFAFVTHPSLWYPYQALVRPFLSTQSVPIAKVDFLSNIDCCFAFGKGLPLIKIIAMKVLLDVKDNKAEFIMQLLKSFNFVKAKTITPAKALLIEEMKEAVEELKQVRSGKKKGRKAEEFLNEL